MSLHLRQKVARRNQSLSQLNSFPREKRCHLLAEGQPLLDGYSKVRTRREAQPIGQGKNRVIHVQEHFGDRADVHYGFKKTENRREHPPALDNGGGADGIQGHVGYSREHDQPEREKYHGVHSKLKIQCSIAVMPAAAAASSIQRLIPFRGLILWIGYFGSPT